MAEQADLRGTDLTRADLTAANLGQARMDFADLRGANLTDADLTEVSLRGALADNDTTWPDRFDPVAAGVTSRPDAGQGWSVRGKAHAHWRLPGSWAVSSEMGTTRVGAVRWHAWRCRYGQLQQET